MSFALLAGLNALALICLYLYFARRIDRRLAEEKLLDALQSQADRIVKELLQELNRVTDRNITLMEQKVDDVRKILDTADKRILLMRGRIEKEEAAGKLEERLRPGKPRREPPAARIAQTAEASPAAEEELPAGSHVMDLYRRGISPELIAKRLDVPAGEVELIISLQGHKRKNP